MSDAPFDLASLAETPDDELDYDVGDLVARPSVAPLDFQTEAVKELYNTRRGEVAPSAELERVLTLPRRQPPEPGSVESLALVEFMTARHRKPDGPCDCAQRQRRSDGSAVPCITRLREVQAWALHEIRTYGGVDGSIGVGHGKTLLDLVAPMALRGCRTAVLLVPANLVKQLIADYELLANHWYLPTLYVHGRGETDRHFTGATPDGSHPPELHAISYNRLSRAEATTWLHDVRPDLIIADEADKLADLNTATVSRFIRYCLEHPNTRLVWWTGSPTDRSILEYCHLSQVALGEGSPVPRVFFPTAPDGGLALEQDIAMDWARAIDPPPNPGAKPAPPGPLMRLCEPGESLWEGFHRRLIESPGFIHTTTSSDDTPIRVIERDGIDVPLTIQIALDVLREDMARPDGWTFENPLETSACARQLACGFYYRWEYPRGEPAALIEEWLATRKAFCGELRWKLKTDRREHMDSELLLKRAAARFYGDLPPDPSLPTWECRSWPAWRDIADKVVPTTVPQFLDDYLVHDAVAWAEENAGPIWYESNAFGEWIAELSGLEIYGGGPDGEKRIASLVASGRRRPVILSLSSHGRGRNGLQYLFCTQLVAQPPSTPKRWEQMLGRLSRPGQTAAEVECHVYRHTEELDDAVTTACGRAAYVRGTMGADQKLLNGVERQRSRGLK